MKLAVKKPKRDAQEGDIKICRGFAFWPIQIDENTKVWFEFYKLEKMYIDFHDGIDHWMLYDKKTNNRLGITGDWMRAPFNVNTIKEIPIYPELSTLQEVTESFVTPKPTRAMMVDKGVNTSILYNKKRTKKKVVKSKLVKPLSAQGLRGRFGFMQKNMERVDEIKEL